MPNSSLEIFPIPAFSDNYIWLLSRGGPECAVVDPGEHEPVLEVLRAKGLDLRYILLTHHHWDHSGGIPGLLEHYDAQVFGPLDDRLDDWCQPCREGDTVSLPDLGLEFGVLDIPAHTRSHVAFHGHGMVFSGDTLFSIGCGRLFEGTPAQMQDAMDKLAELPPETRVYCGHEYTRSNCQFALQVEPDNTTLQARSRAVQALRDAGEVTLPSTIGEELAANPFMRCREPSVVEAARGIEPEAVAGASTMAVIRAWKDRS
jgi:hydroxyacylglutathione hydrolase